MQSIKLYKYSSINSAINIIKNSSVLLNSPNNFNDPFDSLINISNEEKQRVLDLIINYYTFKIFCDFVNREDLHLKPSQKLIFKTIKFEIAAYTKLIKKSKTYNLLPFFNDMVDNFSEINDDIKIAIDSAKDKFENEIIPSLKEMRSKARISCFSSKNDSILMWSHYADSHRGVCFEFEENRDFFKSVNYSSQRANINLYDAISRVLAFDFLNEKISYKDKKFSDIMLNPLYTKSLEWVYENEVRCVLSDEEYNTPGFFYKDNKCMLKMNISKIYIGSKAFGDNLEELLYLAQNRKIPVVFMKEDENKYLIVPDIDKKMDGKHKGITYKNSLETLIDEINNNLSNESYVSAMICALVIPGIMGKLVYPELAYKDAYIKWYHDNLGQYDYSGTGGMPYLTGEVCYNLKCSLHDYGDEKGVINEYTTFNIDRLKLIIEEKNSFDMYGSEASLNNYSSGRHFATLEVNIREFCIRVIKVARYEIDNNKELLNKISKIDLRYFSKEVEELEESNVIIKNI